MGYLEIQIAFFWTFDLSWSAVWVDGDVHAEGLPDYPEKGWVGTYLDLSPVLESVGAPRFLDSFAYSDIQFKYFY